MMSLVLSLALSTSPAQLAREGETPPASPTVSSGSASPVTSSAMATPRFALVVGVNDAVDEDLALLKFPDDDALAYARLFELLGMDTVVVTRADDDTRALDPDRAARALPPTRAGLRAALASLSAKIAASLARGEQPELVFAYAGHGSVKGGVGYITLEDGRLTGQDLERLLVNDLGAARTHLIIDACYSVFLAYHRGPGGDRRPAAGFSQLRGLLQNPRVGLLLSTSATNLTHEWERFSAGVFSHLVRSALYGAADVDQDRWIDYREVAAFVTNATGTIENRRYRPSVYAKPPVSGDRLAFVGQEDLPRVHLGHTLRGRFLLEDGKGLRFADFHHPGGDTELLRPATDSTLYLRSWDDGRERVLPDAPGRVEVASLDVTERPLGSRGAAEEAMEQLLAQGFSDEAVQAYAYPTPEGLSNLEVPVEPLPTWRLLSGWGAVGTGAALAGLGGVFTFLAVEARMSVDDGAPHEDAAEANRAIADGNLRAGAAYVGAAAAVAVGATLLLWPSAPPETGLVEEGAP